MWSRGSNAGRNDEVDNFERISTNNGPVSSVYISPGLLRRYGSYYYNQPSRQGRWTKKVVGLGLGSNLHSGVSMHHPQPHPLTGKDPLSKLEKIANGLQSEEELNTETEESSKGGDEDQNKETLSEEDLNKEESNEGTVRSKSRHNSTTSRGTPKLTSVTSGRGTPLPHSTPPPERKSPEIIDDPLTHKVKRKKDSLVQRWMEHLPENESRFHSFPPTSEKIIESDPWSKLPSPNYSESCKFSSYIPYELIDNYEKISLVLEPLSPLKDVGATYYLFNELDADYYQLRPDAISEDERDTEIRYIVFQKKKWPSVYHLYLASRFPTNEKIVRRIRKTRDPKEAKRLADAATPYVAMDGWKSRDEANLRTAIWCKFTYSRILTNFLLSTYPWQLTYVDEDERLGVCVEMELGEVVGENGENLVGEILMDTRYKLRMEAMSYEAKHNGGLNKDRGDDSCSVERNESPDNL